MMNAIPECSYFMCVCCLCNDNRCSCGCGFASGGGTSIAAAAVGPAAAGGRRRNGLSSLVGFIWTILRFFILIYERLCV